MRLKMKLHSIFFKDVVKAYEDAVAKIENRAKSEIQKVNFECDKKTALWECAKRALDDEFDIVGYGENKKKEMVIIVREHSGNSLNYYLYGESYKACNSHPRILGTIHTEYSSGLMYVKIEDIPKVKNNIGNGSILMEKYIEYCRKIGANYISGWLSDVDKKHFDRSEAFYKKHGFEVNFNEERTSGNIRLYL